MESNSSLHEADAHKNWHHEGCGLLEGKEPGFMEVLGNSCLNVLEGAFILLNHHSRNDVVTLVILELKLLPESQMPQAHKEKNKSQSCYLPCFFLNSRVFDYQRTCKLLHEQESNDDWGKKLEVEKPY